MSKVVEKVVSAIGPVVEREGYELVDTEFVKEGPDWFLRVYIDQESGIQVDDCAKISHLLSEFLDKEEDLIPQAYYLEVSSPGIERVLKKDKDFVRFQGSKIQVKLFTKFNDRKKYIGVLQGATEAMLMVLDQESGEEVSIPRELISRVNIVWES